MKENTEINIEELSDQELIEIVDDLQKDFISEDSIVRKLAKQYFGGDSLTQLLFVANKLLPVITDRMKTYSPHLK